MGRIFLFGYNAEFAGAMILLDVFEFIGYRFRGLKVKPGDGGQVTLADRAAIDTFIVDQDFGPVPVKLVQEFQVENMIGQ